MLAGFSAALCRGLIEARMTRRKTTDTEGRFPRLYAAASLKHQPAGGVGMQIESFPRLYAAASLKPSEVRINGFVFASFSAALCRGLIEAVSRRGALPDCPRTFSAALCRGLIEARRRSTPATPRSARFPRLYAAASLKPPPPAPRARCSRPFSAALCRGLIEAPSGAAARRR